MICLLARLIDTQNDCICTLPYSRRDPYLNLGLDVFDGVRGLHLQGDGLAGEGFHEDLHSSSQPQNQVKG